MSDKNSENSEKMDFEEVGRLALAEIALAETYTKAHGVHRIANWDRYYGRPLGNEVAGRSRFITREMMDTVEWMMPYLTRMFAAGDPKIDITIQDQPAWVGKALMEKIQLDLSDSDPGFFVIFYQWAKDALISDTAFVKVGWDIDKIKEKFNLPEAGVEQLQELAQNPDVEIEAGEGGVGQDGRPVFRNVSGTIEKVIKDELSVQGIPHWEFLVSENCKTIDDEHPKGQCTKVTLDYLKRVSRARTPEGEEPFFQHLEEFEECGGGNAETSLEGEKSSYMDTQDGEEGGAEDKTSVFHEWYTRLDVDGDGFQEDIICYFADRRLLRWELNEEKENPFVSMKPIIDCYKFFGTSFADLLLEIQNLRTQLFRRILDNFDFQTLGRWRVDPDGQVDLNALYSNVPGGSVFAKAGAIENLSPPPFNPSMLSMLSVVDSIKENRTGITKYNQGLDSNTLNKTATGIIQIQNAAMQRLELVARVFAETGPKVLYRKIVLQYQKYLKAPFTTKVLGTEREVPIEMIQGKVICKVNMGVEESLGQKEAGNIQQVTNYLMGLSQSFPGLLTPEKVHNLATRFTKAFGFTQADDFINDIEAFQKVLEETQQNNQKMMGMQQQMAEKEAELKDRELSIKEQSAGQKTANDIEKLKIEMQKMIQDGQMIMEQVNQKDKDSLRDHEVGMLNALLKQGKESHEYAV